jgi:hypothetical protein
LNGGFGGYRTLRFGSFRAGFHSNATNIANTATAAPQSRSGNFGASNRSDANISAPLKTDKAPDIGCRYVFKSGETKARLSQRKGGVKKATNSTRAHSSKREA